MNHVKTLNWIIVMHTDEMRIVKYFKNSARHRFKYLSLSTVLRKRNSFCINSSLLCSVSLPSPSPTPWKRYICLNKSWCSIPLMVLCSMMWFECEAHSVKHIFEQWIQLQLLDTYILTLGPLLSAADYFSDFSSFKKKLW